MNLGSSVALVTAFLSAVMDLLTVFGVFDFTDAQKTAVVTVATAFVPVGLLAYSLIHTYQNPSPSRQAMSGAYPNAKQPVSGAPPGRR